MEPSILDNQEFILQIDWFNFYYDQVKVIQALSGQPKKKQIVKSFTQRKPAENLLD